MKLAKILNNNVAIVFDEQGRESVVMGRGLAFKKRVGDTLDPISIEKTFSLQNGILSKRLSELLAEIPLDVVTLSSQIITLAQKVLPGKLNEGLFIALTDHCHFAIERHKQGLDIYNALLWDIKWLYPSEYAIGMEALKMIAEQLQVTLPEDEAGFIALHLVNAQLNSEIPEVMSITKVMHEILHIVKYQLQLELKEDTLSYHRFITHLKFFAQRMLGKNGVHSDDTSLHDRDQLYIWRNQGNDMSLVPEAVMRKDLLAADGSQKTTLSPVVEKDDLSGQIFIANRTQGASVAYSYDNNNWTIYAGSFTPKSDAATLYAKAVRYGWKASPSTTFSLTK
ncbi:BglG family transcription antiterminator LicT [Martelella alba]|uniref:PRD domain-containing protein n=1 Tax=Martelella alba TaxID=2590451 RepID=A0ABY2SJ91_9HYPH|nr:PRD domain-containing protein [Martelella alba]TKI04601.1 PRD domain-containing protein [Martelella alba]